MRSSSSGAPSQGGLSVGAYQAQVADNEAMASLDHGAENSTPSGGADGEQEVAMHCSASQCQRRGGEQEVATPSSARKRQRKEEATAKTIERMALPQSFSERLATLSAPHLSKFVELFDDLHTSEKKVLEMLLGLRPFERDTSLAAHLLKQLGADRVAKQRVSSALGDKRKLQAYDKSLGRMEEHSPDSKQPTISMNKALTMLCLESQTVAAKMVPLSDEDRWELECLLAELMDAACEVGNDDDPDASSIQSIVEELSGELASASVAREVVGMALDTCSALASRLPGDDVEAHALRLGVMRLGRTLARLLQQPPPASCLARVWAVKQDPDAICIKKELGPPTDNQSHHPWEGHLRTIVRESPGNLYIYLVYANLGVASLKAWQGKLGPDLCKQQCEQLLRDGFPALGLWRQHTRSLTAVEYGLLQERISRNRTVTENIAGKVEKGWECASRRPDLVDGSATVVFKEPNVQMPLGKVVGFVIACGRPKQVDKRLKDDHAYTLAGPTGSPIGIWTACLEMMASLCFENPVEIDLGAEKWKTRRVCTPWFYVKAAANKTLFQERPGTLHFWSGLGSARESAPKVTMQEVMRTLEADAGAKASWKLLPHMTALSVAQPYAQALVEGHKRIEHRPPRDAARLMPRDM
eukprot:TRINITY_DN16258_c0_g1_i1.p1 TRINITY_DN16258_c0_g1~~TRINITY_DN16258_c0_g1_i1.p1  ORF type:complete len:642 (-),score=96.32 TRINITY_DN16258_c0_g1_i1:150-2075(-)